MPAGRTNLWGDVPEVIEMQSEGGAAGTLHGASLQGALATTFTASQGLLLMLPNMYKVAGELTPAVIHVAARAMATHALSIFGDHSDVMAARTTGLAILCSTSVQEAHDMAAVAHAATLRSRVPFLHVIDGFRTSHELNRVEVLATTTLLALVPEEDVAAHRHRGLAPDHPVVRGTAQNPDAFFQAREAANPFHDAVPAGGRGGLRRAGGPRTGRRYGLVEYRGHPEAERVLVMSGSGVGAAARGGGRAGRRGRTGRGCSTSGCSGPSRPPAPGRAAPHGRAVWPCSTAPRSRGRWVSRCCSTSPRPSATPPGAGDRDRDAPGHRRPLRARPPRSSPRPWPRRCSTSCRPTEPRAPFTVGIIDDVTLACVDPRPRTSPSPTARVQAVLVGLGSDGTVGAAKPR